MPSLTLVSAVCITASTLCYTLVSAVCITAMQHAVLHLDITHRRPSDTGVQHEAQSNIAFVYLPTHTHVVQGPSRSLAVCDAAAVFSHPQHTLTDTSSLSPVSLTHCRPGHRASILILLSQTAMARNLGQR